MARRERDPITIRSRRAINAWSLVAAAVLGGGACVAQVTPWFDNFMLAVLAVAVGLLVLYGVGAIGYDTYRNWREASRKLQRTSVVEIWRAIGRGKGDQR